MKGYSIDVLDDTRFVFYVRFEKFSEVFVRALGSILLREEQDVKSVVISEGKGGEPVLRIRIDQSSPKCTSDGLMAMIGNLLGREDIWDEIEGLSTNKEEEK